MRVFPVFSALGFLAIQSAAHADALDVLRKSSFTLADRASLKSLLADPSKTSATVALTMALKDGRVDPKTLQDIKLSQMTVMDDCRVESLNNDGQLQILCRIDVTGRERPTILVSIFKRNGVLSETELAEGEGTIGIGRIALLLKDLRPNGQKELVFQEPRFIGIDGTRYATVDPAPMVTNIYRFDGSGFVLANADFKSYFSATVLPTYQKQLLDLQAAASPADAYALQQHHKAIKATKESIDLTKRVIATGKYW